MLDITSCTSLKMTWVSMRFIDKDVKVKYSVYRLEDFSLRVFFNGRLETNKEVYISGDSKYFCRDRASGSVTHGVLPSIH